MHVTLNPGEIMVLFRQNPETSHDGGFQGFLVSLQNRINRTTGELELSAQDLERIPRYAFNYTRGGWETRLIEIFGRVLGARLGRID
jgi:hypothetical protein